MQKSLSRGEDGFLGKGCYCGNGGGSRGFHGGGIHDWGSLSSGSWGRCLGCDRCGSCGDSNGLRRDRSLLDRLLLGRSLLRVGTLVASSLFSSLLGLLSGAGGVGVPTCGVLAETNLLLANVPAFKAQVIALAVTIALVDATVAVGDIAIITRSAARLVAEVLAKVLVATEELFVDNDLGLEITNLFDEDALGVLQDDGELLLDDADVNPVTDSSLLYDDLLVETTDKVAVSIEIVKIAGLLSPAVVVEAPAVTERGYSRLSGKVDVRALDAHRRGRNGGGEGESSSESSSESGRETHSDCLKRKQKARSTGCL